jgi:hypothetical protein
MKEFIKKYAYDIGIILCLTAIVVSNIINNIQKNEIIETQKKTIQMYSDGFDNAYEVAMMYKRDAKISDSLYNDFLIKGLKATKWRIKYITEYETIYYPNDTCFCNEFPVMRYSPDTNEIYP